MSATTPSVGRILHYHRAERDHSMNVRSDQPMAAQIVHVNEDGTVNVNVIDHLGHQWSCLSVPIAEGDGSNVNAVKHYLTWMPYQRAVAAGEKQAEQHA